MNEKIQRLIKELAFECAKNDVSFQLSAFDERGKVAIAQGGNEDLIALIVLEQYKEVKKAVEKVDCDCPKHRLMKELFGIVPEEESDDIQIDEKLAAFLRGEFNG